MLVQFRSAALLFALIYCITFPTFGEEMKPDEVAMVLATMAVHGKFCVPKANEQPLNIAVAKLGQDVVDFLPNNRYGPLVDVKMKKALEFLKGTGTQLACQGMGEVLRRYLPDIYSASTASTPIAHSDLSLLGHALWEINGKDENNKFVRHYRRFVLEGPLVRNVFVLSCYRNKSKPIVVEVIPPTQKLSALRELSQGKQNRAMIIIQTSMTMYRQINEVDASAGFLDVANDDFPEVVKIISDTGLTVSMYNDKIAYQIIADVRTTEQISKMLQDPDYTNAFGHARFLPAGSVVSECNTFRNQ